MAVSIMLPPEAMWGYENVTAAYNEKPSESWQKIIDRVKKLYPDADEDDIIRLIGKKPEDM